jgi:methyl-accepting chemotaxis protein
MPDPNIPEFQVPQEGVPSAQNAADAFSRIATSVERHADAADKINEALKRIPSHADEITRKFANVNLELKAMVELADDTEEAVKLINSQAKSLRKGIIDTKSAKDAHHILESIVSTQKIIQERVKKGSQNWAQSVKIVKELEAVMGKIRKEGELTTEEIETLNKAMLEAEKTGERMAKNFKAVSLNHITRQSVAIQRAWASMGVGKGMAARVEKYVGFADVAQKLKDAQKARIQENREAFRRRREEALAAVQEQFGEDMASPAAQAKPSAP